MRSHGRIGGAVSVSSRPKNKLLAGLPDDDFKRLRQHLRTLPMQSRRLWNRAHQPIEDVLFPNGGVISVTTAMTGGAIVEVSTVGNEGLVGIEVFLGAHTSFGETMVQVPDTDCEALPVDAFRGEIDRRGALFASTQRYAQGHLILSMQSAACLALHAVQERCCRWLLMTHDRLGRDTFQLSQEFLAMMLGATRPTVSVVAGALQKAGLITYTHGRMTILDRKGLQAGSCECYAAVRTQFDQLGL